MTRKGRLIAIEGIDGTGKTTQVGLLVAWLLERGLDAVALKEPTGGRHGREIAALARDGGLADPEKELRLFMEDRREDVEASIRPALEAGKVVVMDRYYPSNVAYQGARGLDPERIRAENEAFAPVPDLVVVLDLDPDSSMGRVRARAGVVKHFENEEYLGKVREIFLGIGRLPNAVVIDAGAPPARVHARIVEAVRARLHF